MANSRKRARKLSIASRDARKRLKTGYDEGASTLVGHPTLCLYYHRVMTLRHFLLASLPPTSRIRRRKIASIGRNEPILEEERCLASLLDYTLVCAVSDESSIPKKPLEKDFVSFSQQANLSTGSSNDVGSTTISEV